MIGFYLINQSRKINELNEIINQIQEKQEILVESKENNGINVNNSNVDIPIIETSPKSVENPAFRERIIQTPLEKSS